MLITAVMSLGLTFISAMLSIASIVSIPTSTIATIQTITGYASWVVGEDLLLLIFSSIVAWYSLRLGVALVRFFFELKP